MCKHLKTQQVLILGVEKREQFEKEAGSGVVVVVLVVAVVVVLRHGRRCSRSS